MKASTAYEQSVVFRGWLVVWGCLISLALNHSITLVHGALCRSPVLVLVPKVLERVILPGCDNKNLLDCLPAGVCVNFNHLRSLFVGLFLNRWLARAYERSCGCGAARLISALIHPVLKTRGTDLYEGSVGQL